MEEQRVRVRVRLSLSQSHPITLSPSHPAEETPRSHSHGHDPKLAIMGERRNADFPVNQLCSSAQLPLHLDRSISTKLI